MIPSQERKTAKSHVSCHISVAIKVSAFLKSSNMIPSHLNHCARLEVWLHTLGSQIAVALPPPPVKVAPPLQLIHTWVEVLISEAEEVMHSSSPPTPKQALHIQAALVARFVTGHGIAPLRLSIIKSLLHPSMVREREGGGREREERERNPKP